MAANSLTNEGIDCGALKNAKWTVPDHRERDLSEAFFFRMGKEDPPLELL
jgi:hypothetical protein